MLGVLASVWEEAGLDIRVREAITVGSSQSSSFMNLHREPSVPVLQADSNLSSDGAVVIGIATTNGVLQLKKFNYYINFSKTFRLL